MAAPPHPSRFSELISLLRQEYDRVSNENQGYQGIRSEFSRRAEEQASELTAMLAEFHDLERKHQHVKKRYEADIHRLKGQPAVPPAAAPPPPPSAAASTAALPQTTLTPKRRPEGSSQLPSYNTPIPQSDHALPTLFSRPAPQPQPAGPPQQRLMSIPSLTPAPNTGIAPPPPPPPQSIRQQPMSGKMPAMSLMQPPNGPAPGNPAFGPPGPRPGVISNADPVQQAQTAGADDWVVYQGRAANGSMVNMKVSLQHTLHLQSVVCCVRYSWDGQYLATGSNHAAHIFDTSTGQSVATFSKDSGTQGEEGTRSDRYVRAVCFSPDGNWLITGAEDHVVKVWDVRNRKVKHRLVGHGTDIYSVDASANSQFIISGSGDKKAKLWNLETGNLMSTLGGEYGPTDGITSVSVSPTSQHVAAGSLDKVVRVWDVESARLVREFLGHRDSVYSVAFSPDGRLLLSGSLDKTLKLWDLAVSQLSSQCRLSFMGHKDFVLSVAFSPNGRWLISGSKDRTVQFWDPRQSTMCLMLQGHKNSVISIAHNPTSKSLATGSGDCRARTWMYSS